MIDIILWDIDGTLLDFEAAEDVSIRKCLALQGQSATDTQLNRYKEINDQYWKALEKGEVTKDELYPGRFRDWFIEMGFENMDSHRMNADYQRALGENPVLREDTISVLKYFKNKGFRQYVLTNGSIVAQEGKLASSGIGDLMDGIFISEKMGVPKPQKKYYDMCAQDIEGYDNSRAVMIGDSISSDIAGGNNAGIACIWFNPKGEINNSGLRIDATVKTLSEIINVIETWNMR